jgi:hypothetical protein
MKLYEKNIHDVRSHEGYGHSDTREASMRFGRSGQVEFGVAA